MDIMQVNEKVKIRDIFSSLKDIFLKSESSENQENLEKELQKIYKVQVELGVTDDIAKLETDIQTHTTSDKLKNRNKSKVSTKRVIIEEDKEIQKNTLNKENSVER